MIKDANKHKKLIEHPLVEEPKRRHDHEQLHAWFESGHSRTAATRWRRLPTEVGEEVVHSSWVGDEGDDPHGVATASTAQR